jgi:Immunity protein 53
MVALDELGDWYRAQCDGDWEHTYGIHIETLDNPGWWVKVDLRDTILEGQPFSEIRFGDSAKAISWIACKVEGLQFSGAGDPSRLQEIIVHFIRWAKDRPDWLTKPVAETLSNRDDAELWAHLGIDCGSEPCRVKSYEKPRVRHSVFCRFHHWEKVFGRPCPFDENAT